MALLFEEKIKSDRSSFVSKINKVASDLGVPANWLMAVINSETAGTFSPSIQNPYTNATGLIQFMPSTAKGLGTTIDALKNMSAVNQLDYVYKYFAPYKGKINSFEDLYLITFYPNADGVFGGTLDKPDNWTFPASIVKQNPGLDSNKDGLITIAEFREFAYRKVPDQFQNLLYKTIGVAKKNPILVIIGVVLMSLAVWALYIEIIKRKNSLKEIPSAIGNLL